MKRTIARIAALVITTAAIGVGTLQHASAHKVDTIGPYTVALGWLHEPAYVGFDNAVQFIVKDSKGAAVTGVAGLTVDVSLGSAAMAGAKLVETADPDTGLGTPGDYEVHFIPTAPGNYTFHVKGTVNGTAIDDNVTASPSTFNEVKTAETAQFPTKVPAVSDVATKVDAIGTRVDAVPAQIDTARQAAANVQSSANDAKNAANRALVVGIIALVLAVLLSIGNLAISLRRGRVKA